MDLRPVGTYAPRKARRNNLIREQTGCSVIAINVHGESNINPDPSIPLGENDEMILIGTADAEKRFLENYYT